eukprot:13576304-Alexandrium_andersonii.AAC.1
MPAVSCARMFFAAGLVVYGFQAGCLAACCRLLCPTVPACAAAFPGGCGAVAAARCLRCLSCGRSA